MGSKKNVDMTVTQDTVKIVEETPVAPAAESDAANTAAETTDKDQSDQTEAQSEEAPKAAPKKVHKRNRSKKYTAARAQVDRTREYDAFAAVELVKRLSYSSFGGTISASAVVKEVGDQGSLTLPHSTGKTRTVAIASDAIIKDIEAGKLDFDVLVSTPEFMPKLTKHARVLGPKGLMPNPKSGTLTENPEKKKKELEAGAITLKTQRKMPVLHVTIGKVGAETKELVENLQTLIDHLGMKLQKLSISSTMSPGVRVKVG